MRKHGVLIISIECVMDSFLRPRPVVIVEIVMQFCRRYLAANGAIMRTSVLGALQFNGSHTHTCYISEFMCDSIPDIPAVVANTADIARVTHADPRCSASCAAVTTAVSC